MAVASSSPRQAARASKFAEKRKCQSMASAVSATQPALRAAEAARATILPLLSHQGTLPGAKGSGSQPASSRGVARQKTKEARMPPRLQRAYSSSCQARSLWILSRGRPGKGPSSTTAAGPACPVATGGGASCTASANTATGLTSTGCCCPATGGGTSACAGTSGLTCLKRLRRCCQSQMPPAMSSSPASTPPTTAATGTPASGGAVGCVCSPICSASTQTSSSKGSSRWPSMSPPTAPARSKAV